MVKNSYGMILFRGRLVKYLQTAIECNRLFRERIRNLEYAFIIYFIDYS